MLFNKKCISLVEIFGTDVAEYMAKKTLLDLLVHDAGIPDYNQMMATERTMDWYDSVWNASQFSDPEENTRQRLRYSFQFRLVKILSETNRFFIR